MPGPGTPLNVAIPRSLQSNPSQHSSGPAASPTIAAPQPAPSSARQQWSSPHTAATTVHPPVQPTQPQPPPPQLVGVLSPHTPQLNFQPPGPQSQVAASHVGSPPPPIVPQNPQTPLPPAAQFSQTPGSGLISAFLPFGVPQLPLLPPPNNQPILGGGHQAVLQQLKASSDLQRIVQLQIQYLVSSLLQSGLTIDQISFLMGQNPTLGQAQPLAPSFAQSPFPGPVLPLQGQAPAPGGVDSPRSRGTSGADQAPTSNSPVLLPQDPSRQSLHDQSVPIQALHDDKPHSVPPSVLPQVQQLTPQPVAPQGLSSPANLPHALLQNAPLPARTSPQQHPLGQPAVVLAQPPQPDLSLNMDQLPAIPPPVPPPVAPSVPSPVSPTVAVAPASTHDDVKRRETQRFKHVIPESLRSGNQPAKYITSTSSGPSDLAKGQGAPILRDSNNTDIPQLKPGTRRSQRPVGRPRTKSRVDNLNSQQDPLRHSRDMSIMVSDPTLGPSSENNGKSSDAGKTQPAAGEPTTQRRSTFFARFVEVNPAVKSQWTEHRVGRPPKNRAEGEPKAEPELKVPKKRGRKPGTPNKPVVPLRQRQRVPLDGDSKTRRETRAMERRSRESRVVSEKKEKSDDEEVDVANDSDAQGAQDTAVRSVPPPVQPQSAPESPEAEPKVKNGKRTRSTSAAERVPAAKRALRDSKGVHGPAPVQKSGAPPPVMPLNFHPDSEEEPSDSESEDGENQSEDDWDPAASSQAKRRAHQYGPRSKRAKESAANSSQAASEEQSSRSQKGATRRRRAPTDKTD